MVLGHNDFLWIQRNPLGELIVKKKRQNNDTGAAKTH